MFSYYYIGIQIFVFSLRARNKYENFLCSGRKGQLVEYVADISSYWTFRSCILLRKCEARYNNTHQNIIVILYYDSLTF